MFKLKKENAQGSARKNLIPPIIILGTLAFLGILIACFVHIRLIRDNLKDVISEQYESQLEVAEKAMNDRMKDIEKSTNSACKEIVDKMSKQYSDAQIIQVLSKYATSDDITDYFITSSDISKNSYITNQYLKDNNYTTTSYVDTKIEALELSIKEDMKTYVQGIIEDVFGESLDEIIDNRISENIQSMDSTQIQNLF